MAKIKWMFFATLAILLTAVMLLPVGAQAEKKLYVGGTQSLTGPFAEDSAAVLAAIEDYVAYVNATKNLAPWRKDKFPADIKLEVMWRDDELKPPKALSIYEELKAKGMLVGRISGSPIALALKDRMWEDQMGATSMATGPYYLSPPQSCFTYYPIYTDSIAAIADWFKTSWKEARKPKVAYLTADNAMGRSIEIPEMKAYLQKTGYEFVGTQYVPLVPTSPPTTQLTWLKQKGVDLALGVMINPGSQPTVKEMVRLGMGPNQPYKMTFGVPAPGHGSRVAHAGGLDDRSGAVAANRCHGLIGGFVELFHGSLCAMVGGLATGRPARHSLRLGSAQECRRLNTRTGASGTKPGYPFAPPGRTGFRGRSRRPPGGDRRIQRIPGGGRPHSAYR